MGVDEYAGLRDPLVLIANKMETNPNPNPNRW